jgi:magnesium-transporting ATPase (P-type)
VLSAFLGKPLETAAISAIIVLFALLGFVQEYGAEQAMAALKRLAVPVVRVRRGGVLEELSARDLVPGDIVLLEAGSSISADLRLIESANLRVQEAALTGESEPVEKQTQALTAAKLPLGDRKNMAYMGTFATYGRGIGVVTATGMDTELGRIAELIQSVKQQPTPLQQQLDSVGKQLALFDRETGSYLPIGDPTEGALLVAASQAGLERDALEHWLPRVAELPFDAERKRMTTVHRLPPEPSHLPPVLSAMKGMAGTHIAFCSDRAGAGVALKRGIVCHAGMAHEPRPAGAGAGDLPTSTHRDLRAVSGCVFPGGAARSR